MNSEEKQIKRVLGFAFLTCFVGFAAIRMSALFRCARQQSEAGLPVDPLGTSFGALTPFLGFPLSLVQAQSPSTDTGLLNSLNCGIVLNGLFLGLIAAIFLIGSLMLLTKCMPRRVQPQSS